MSDYQAVRSGLEISKKLVDVLEEIDPHAVMDKGRVQMICMVNDILQGRSTWKLSDYLMELREKAGSMQVDISALSADALAFQAQKALLSSPYEKVGSNTYTYQYTHYNPTNPLKIIDQQLYDRAVKEGFPHNFFQKSHFSEVTFYCLPDHADFTDSIFQDCEFMVCRVKDARFDGASLYSTMFHSCAIDHTTFTGASFGSVHIHDSKLDWVSFQDAQLRRCTVLDSTMENVMFMGTRLDGCCFGRITPWHIRGLENSIITMGGATDAEVETNRAAIFKALDVADTAKQQVTQSRRRRTEMVR